MSKKARGPYESAPWLLLETKRCDPFLQAQQSGAAYQQNGNHG